MDGRVKKEGKGMGGNVSFYHLLSNLTAGYRPTQCYFCENERQRRNCTKLELKLK